MRPLYGKLIFVAIVVLSILGAFFYWVPDVKKLEGCFTTRMFEVSVCPKNASYTKLSSISTYLKTAIIVSEDGLFYSHNGFDWFEMRASFTSNIKAGKIKRGGSTITQQLAKNAFLYNEKSFFRKALEAYLTFRIESLYSKDLILEKYLNMVEFGPKLYGIRAASAKYFQKSPSQLNPLESAYLAHLLPNPKSYSRGFNKGQLSDYSKKMVKVILKRMLQTGRISGPQYQFSLSQVDYFPWSHLNLSSFENLNELGEQQQDAIDRLLEEGWSEEEESEIPEPPPEAEDF